MSDESKKNGIFDYLLTAAVFGLLSYLFYPTLEVIADICWTDDDYSHGVLLPLVSAYMLYDRRLVILEAIKQGSAKDSNWLLAELLLLGGLVLHALGHVSGIVYVSWFAFFPTILGALHLVFGRTCFIYATPPILLLFMAKPLPDSIVLRIFWPLQVLAAKVSGEVLRFLDVPVHMSGNVIEIPQMKLLVEEACSGMRSVMALLTLSLIVLYFVKLRHLFKVFLIGSAIIIAVLLNIFRVALTGVLAHFYDPATATGFFHTFSGMIVFLVALPLLYSVGVMLLKLQGEKSA